MRHLLSLIDYEGKEKARVAAVPRPQHRHPIPPWFDQDRLTPPPPLFAASDKVDGGRIWRREGKCRLLSHERGRRHGIALRA